MFGMSSKEFWEDEPQLYWAYRFSYEKKIEFEQKKELEQIKLACWLNGMTGNVATSLALGNAFSKGKAKPYPAYKEFFKEAEEIINNPVKIELAKRLDGVEDKDERARIEFEYWARL